MNSPTQFDRRSLRYPLALPVSVKVGNQEITARSENISLKGILLSSDLVIPEGSAVELAIGVAGLQDHAMQLTAKGTVIRLRPRGAGNFAVAIECEHPFKLRRFRSNET